MTPPQHPGLCVDLAVGGAWEHRVVVDGLAGPWFGSVAQALGELAPHARPVVLGRWWAYGATEVADGVPSVQALQGEPLTAYAGSVQLQRCEVRPDDRGGFDLTRCFGSPKSGRTAYLVTRFDLSEDAHLRFHCGADWWMQWWLDGRPLLDTLDRGNRSPLAGRATQARATLAAGVHGLVGRIISGDGGWAAAVEVEQWKRPPQSKPFQIECRRRFIVDDPAKFVSLTCVASELDRLRLNGKPIPVPLDGMRYAEATGVPTSLLRAGCNELSLAYDEATSASAAAALSLRCFEASGDDRCIAPQATVLGVPPQAAMVQSGPLVVDIGADHGDITCRTNAPVAVQLNIAGESHISPAGLHHHWHVTGLSAGRDYPYLIKVNCSEAHASGRLATLPHEGPIRIVVCGDAGPLPHVWAENAAAIARVRPHAMVFVGDMVSNGRIDACWDAEFLHPARDLLAQVPCLSVLGNHDENSPLWHRLMLPPHRSRNWAVAMGPALLIGIDGADDWSPEGVPYAWLVRTLRERAAAFTFAFNHYPAWSSGPHLRVRQDGLIVEDACRSCREVILPLLSDHGVTAMFSGHDHLYERSQPNGGPACIVTGGAGAYLYATRGAGKRANPSSNILASEHHYCLMDLTEQACHLRVCSLKGVLLDEQVLRPVIPAGT